MNMRALDMQQLLLIHSFCIEKNTSSLEEWAVKKESENIIWNVQNVFTS